VGETKSLPPEMTARVVACVESLIARYPGKSLRQIAPLVGFEQPPLSAMRKGRGIGILTLIKLRAVTKTSIDDLLGLDPLESERHRRIARLVMSELEKPDVDPGPPEPKKSAPEGARRRR
jgi:hypothetical protein